ncbi:acyl-CoA dehydrogenase [Marinobacter sp. NFXS9]|uniref:acyl-CoA dehydrogenase family protein n=1 Tax=Marinobacter sp. NFXS9 TaxID=2818433 RepID=UPI0032E00823
MLQDNLERFLRENRGQPLWSRLIGEFGLGTLLPRPGAEPLHVEHGLVMEAFGRHLVREPFLEGLVVAGQLLAGSADERAAALAERTAQGAALPVLAWAEPGMRYDFAGIGLGARVRGAGWVLNGRKCMVAGAGQASHFLLAARTSGAPGEARGLSLFVLERGAPGLSVEPYYRLDGGDVADLVLHDVPVQACDLLGEEGGLLERLEWVRDCAIAALCAEARGALAEMLEQTQGYLGERRQFGRRLSDFQVLQHRLVDMYLHLLKAGSASRLAMRSLEDSLKRATAVSAAKVVVADACRFIGQSAVQCHGGMGMCDEVAVSRYFKRVTLIEREFGGRDFHLGRYNALYRCPP